MNNLKETVETARQNLRVMARVRHELVVELGALRALASVLQDGPVLPEGEPGPIPLARCACKVLASRAYRADDDGFPVFADELRCIYQKVSLAVVDYTRDARKRGCDG